MENKVTCAVCGKNYKAISRTHLKTHGMTMEDYKRRYPMCEMQSPQTKKKLSTNRLEYWVEKHGETIGKKKYKEYRNFLAEKNTFEYKNKKYGWSKEDFNEYNKKRAVTLKNLSRKHGDEVGKKLYEDYVDKQRYSGVSEDYFIELLGEEQGKARYKELCKEKAHTLETYTKRYGSKKLAEEKLKEFFSKIESNKFSSELEREFILKVIQRLSEEEIAFEKMYSILNENQYGMWSHRLEKLIKLDLVILDIDACIEFNGNYWHCNPQMYTSDFIHPTLKKTAKEIWKIDEKKKKDVMEKGFNVKVVWELEYRNNKDLVIEEIVKWIKELKDQK